MATRFVPDDFSAPLEFEGDGFRLEPLGPVHNARDHEAWMSSIDHINSTPGFEASDWPRPMSLKSNRADLERHARDFDNRGGFTYSVLDEEEVIGCLYIYPDDDDRHDAAVSSWVRQSRAEMDIVVRREVASWLTAAWPFENPRYASGV